MLLNGSALASFSFAYTCDCSEFPTRAAVRIRRCKESSCQNYVFMVNGAAYNLGPFTSEPGAQG